MFDRDKMMNAPAKVVAGGAMALIDTLQNMPREIQPMAAAAVFLLLAKHYRLEPQDVFTMTDNVMNYAAGRRPEFAAVEAYMKGEL